MPIWAAILWRMTFLTGIYLGCYVFLMNLLIKCSIFTIYASHLLQSIKILYKFNNLVVYFCQHQWLHYYSPGILLGIATLTGIFLGGMPKIVGIFFFG